VHKFTTQTSGTFQSPNHPNNYPNDVQMRWHFEPVVPNARVVLSFGANRWLQPNMDMVYIYEVTSKTVANTLSVCNTGNRKVIGVKRAVNLSEMQSGVAYTFVARETVAVLVDFCTDVSVNGKGFIATFSVASEAPTTSPPTPRPSTCSNSPCVDGGSCTSVFDSIYCECNGTWSVSSQCTGEITHTCKQGWVPFNGHCYKFVLEGMNWHAARRNCMAQGGNLAWFHTAKEHTFLRKMIEFKRPTTGVNPGTEPSYEWIVFWLGGTDLEEEGTWRWSHDNTLVPTQFWASKAVGAVVDEPNNNNRYNENCLIMYFRNTFEQLNMHEKALADLRCEDAFGSICKI
jgi:hypothetical protein